MDLNTIRPLALSQIDWPTFIEATKSFLGTSPTRGCDKEKIDLKEPRAYLGSIDCENKPHEALRRAGVKNILRHYFASFIMVIDDVDILIDLGIRDTLAIRTIKKGNKFLTILSGTMLDWYRAVIIYCNREASIEMREIFNTIYNFFKRANLHEIWSKYSLQIIPDNSFILEA